MEEKKKQKPKQIIVVHRDEETNELIKTFVDKKKRKKVTKLKKAIQIVNQTLNELKVEKHPDKTFIGRIAKGFDFLGYSFEPKGLSIAPKTLANFLDRKTQLYEQGATVRRIGLYVRNYCSYGCTL